MENLAPTLTSKIAVVLVGARNPLNIGAVARAMSNFGFADLRIVNDYAIALEDARSAVNAADVVKAARTFATVAEAVADCTLVYGTTAVGDRKPEHPVDMLREALPHFAENASRGARSAILFGSEKTGLSNDSISYCHRLLTIPMFEHGTSMNLGQAAAVCLYEMIRAEQQHVPVSTDAEPATTADLLVLDTVLTEALELSQYQERFHGKGTAQQVREYTRRMKLPAKDVPVWIGFFRQFLWKMRGGQR